ncbi:MAG: shikimate dehydrogenase [Chloroflexi bacterium]|mgnify:CR=1 FL=1|nr:shikimate dehydrogenase [Chloroflexota bacterium]
MNSTNYQLPITNYQLGLIGYPLTHSLSPQIHAAALKACGLEGDYIPFTIHPNDMHGLKALLARLRSGELHGLNVTIPHKQTVIGYLDELTPTAQAIGAVNTIYLREGKLIGDNTDSEGFSTDLKRAMGYSFFSLHPSVLILGAGGSARAVVHALLNDGWNVTIAARRLEQAQQLAASFPHYDFPINNLQTFQLSNFQLIVNTTPLGMFPNIETSPLPENLSLPSNAFVYDLVYNPRETKLVRRALSQGLQAATGLGMLIEQAALAFQLWTGHNPPRDVLWAAVEN